LRPCAISSRGSGEQILHWACKYASRTGEGN
jgi:hypothetical protein